MVVGVGVAILSRILFNFAEGARLRLEEVLSTAESAADMWRLNPSDKPIVNPWYVE